MTDTIHDDDRHPVEQIAEEFANAIRNGLSPNVDDFANRYPEHADLLRTILPSIQLVETVSQQDSQLNQSGAHDPRQSVIAATPSILGDFQIVREVGRGGMGIVYEAVQQSLNRHVALKVISSLISSNQQHKARFRREAEAAASLHHTNIVPIYGIGEEHGLQYYAMQLIDGVTLHDVIECLRDNSLSSVPVVLQNPQNVDNTNGSSGTFSGVLRTKLQFNSADAARWMLSKPTAETTVIASPLPTPKDSSKNLPSQNTQSNANSLDFDLTSQSTSQSTSRSLEEQRDATVPIAAEKSQPRSIRTDKTTANSQSKPIQLTREYFRNVARTIANAANALDYAHHQRILHRDIKPANLLLDREGTVWITDFGLARRTDLDAATQTGEVLGTLRYMAPEQIDGQGDSRMDIYSLGLTLYELLTLRPAIESPKARLLDPKRNSAIVAPRSIDPSIPNDLQTITLKACAFEQSARYQHASELEEDLRRFLEDRPILARRATKAEQVVRWARRNPAIASLASATFLLLGVLAATLGIWNRQQHYSLVEIQKQKDEIANQKEAAIQNLNDKVAALALVEQERSRAEKNLDLAMKAFEQIANNIASRGNTLAIGSGIEDEDLLDLSGATLSQADVALLDSLLEFFDQFAKQNAKDLKIEVAVAQQRIGDIQHKLGQLNEAEASYRIAMDAFLSINRKQTDQPECVLPLIAIYNELMIIQAKRGQLQRAGTMYDDARRILDDSPRVAKSAEGRFALAKLLNSIGTLGAKFGRDLRMRPNRPIMARFAPTPDAFKPEFITRLKRDSERNAEALALLKQLVSESPDNDSYQVVLARTLKDEVRIARMTQEFPRAEDALRQAIEIFETLGRAHPDSAAFQYELADTLSATVTMRPADQQRCERALAICDKITKENPHVPEYRSLRATTLAKLAMFMGKTNKAEELLKESITIQQDLSRTNSDVIVYGIGLLQSLRQLAELHAMRGNMDKAIDAIEQAVQEFSRLRKTNKLPNLMSSTIEQELKNRRATLEKRIKELKEAKESKDAINSSNTKE